MSAAGHTVAANHQGTDAGDKHVTPKQAELNAEQGYFDKAWEAREASRATLAEAGAAAGGARKSQAQIAKVAKETIEKLGSPEDEVAFGRIDLDGESLYLGTRVISTEERDLLVISWQAPAAAPYYEATFANPLGVSRKRTFKNEANRIQDFDDVLFEDLADRVADLTAEQQWGVDDALLRDMESSRSGEMRDIVQTIHAAQYELIRTPLDNLLVIQGGPGTGKTAVALHRVSWLLFNANDLAAEDILVVGPNPTFNRYIRSVLPKLGDDNVEYRDLSSLGPQRATGREERADVVRIKGELRMAELLATALRQRVRFPERTDVVEVGGGFGSPKFTRPEIEAELPAHLERNTYNGGRASFRNYLLREAESRLGRGATIPPAALENALERIWPSLNATAFLRDLLGSRDRLLAAAGEHFNAAEIGVLFRPASEKVSEEQWSEVDVALVDEAEELINGRPVQFKHIVVDEAQDLSPMQLRSIRRRSPQGSMTVVGDLAQSTGPWARDTWDEIAQILQLDHPYSFQELTLGYRVPQQVYEFAAKLLPYAAPGLTPPTVVRRGPAEPELTQCGERDLVTQAIAAAREHASNGRFVGLICSEAMRGELEAELNWRDIRWGNVGAGNLDTSINLARPGESKGLEFDAVVVVDPQRIVSESPWGLRHLYVALTRTTKYLTVLHTGTALPLPGDETPAPELLEAAEVKTIEQLPFPTMDTSPRLPVEIVTRTVRRGGRHAAKAAASQPAPGRIMRVMAHSAAKALAAEIREEVQPELWPILLDALRDELFPDEEASQESAG